MWAELLTDKIKNKVEKNNLINEHTLNREPVSLTLSFHSGQNDGFGEG